MSAIDEQLSNSTRVAPVAEPDRRTRLLRYLRWTAVGVWAIVIVWRTVTDGFA